MSANGEIEIAVKAEGADEAAADLADEEDGDGNVEGVSIGNDGDNGEGVDNGEGGIGDIGDISNDGGNGDDGDNGEGEQEEGGAVSAFVEGGIVGGLLASLDSIVSIMEPILKILNAFLAPVAVLLLRLLQPLMRFLLTQILPAWLGFMAVVNDWISKLSGLAKVAILVGAILAGILALSVGITALPGLIAAAILGGATIAGIIDAVNDLPGDIVDTLVDFFEQPGETTKDIAKTGVKNFWPDWIDFMPPILREGGAPRTMAEGGIVTGPTTALIGEGNQDEAVIPLDRLERMLSDQQSGGGTSVQISGGLAPFVQEVERSSQVDL